MSMLLFFLWGCQSSKQIQDGYLLIEGGDYQLGDSLHSLNQAHTATLAPFWIGVHEVTNAEFQAFVEATAYVTIAERDKNAKVFYPGLGEFKWVDDSTANWRFPNGVSRGGITEKMDHPVTTVSFIDIKAYCKWAGVRLPTLDEWEVAARHGTRSVFFWGNNKMAPISEYGNVWGGKDHLVPDSVDAYLYTAPVGSFSPSPNGLFDIYGNVFEFCADRPGRMQDQDDLACARGGSWWCSTHSCAFFNSLDIGRSKIWASFSNQGFRVVKDKP